MLTNDKQIKLIEGRISQLHKSLENEINSSGILCAIGEEYANSGRIEKAIKYLCQAVSADPNNAISQIALGFALLRSNRYLEAACAFRQGIRLDGDAKAYRGLGLAQQEMGEFDLAAASHRSAIEKCPDDVNHRMNLASVLLASKKYEDAYNAAKSAQELKPSSIDFYPILAEAKFGQGDVKGGLAWVRRGLRRDRQHIDLNYNMGRTLFAINRYDKAATYFQRAIDKDPNHVQSHFGLSTCLLARGKFAEGWREHEWRLKIKNFQKTTVFNAMNECPEPLWNGEPLDGKTILVYAEQGFGDIFQMVRYVRELEKKGCKVILLVYPEVQEVISYSFPSATVISYGELTPRFDFHVPIFSLPKIFNTNLHTIPHEVPYLKVREIGGRPSVFMRPKKMKIGLFWTSGKLNGLDYRSTKLQHISSLFEFANIDFYSFQIRGSGIELERYKQRKNIHDLSPFITSWSDTARLLLKMDLLISIDSGIAHLAGALGVPVWVMLTQGACWRWLPGVKGNLLYDKTPWYNNMRLFRSHKNTSFEDLARRIKDELTRILNRDPLPRDADV